MRFQEEVSNDYFLSRRRPQRTYLRHRNVRHNPSPHSFYPTRPFLTQPCHTGFPFFPHLSCTNQNHQSHLFPDIPNTAGQLADACAILARCPNSAPSFKPTSELGNSPPRHISAPAPAHLVGFYSMIKSTTEIPAESPPSRPPWTDLPRNVGNISFFSC
ncbi:hypothetical protein H4582DRAFT_2012898, partial [Lactarius indigo]